MTEESSLTALFSVVAKNAIKDADQALAGEIYYRTVLSKLEAGEELSNQFGIKSVNKVQLRKYAQKFLHDCTARAEDKVWSLGDRLKNRLSYRVSCTRPDPDNIPFYSVRYDIKTRHGSVFVNIKTRAQNYAVKVESKHLPKELREDAERNAASIAGAVAIG
jgi:hypothetical protein